MASIVSVSTGRYVEARVGTPVSTLTAKAASWRGNSMLPQRSFPLLRGQSFAASGSGRYHLIDRTGPRIGSMRGTIDCWFRMGSGASSVALIQSAYGSTAAPLITVGVTASGQPTGSVHDGSGAIKSAWTAGSMGVLAQGALVHLQFAWDASRFLVTSIVNDAVMPATDFTTTAATSWVPFQPTYLTTGIFTGTGFDGEMILTQVGMNVVI